MLRLDLEGESADAGRWFAARVAGAEPGTALVAGGEATTTLAHGAAMTAGGGPSQEGALAGALELDASEPGARESCLLYLDSDGSDGPTDAAGALVDDATAAALHEARVDAAAALAAHAAGAALATTADLVVTGPTGTNVNDLKIGLVGGR